MKELTRQSLGFE